MVTNSGVIMCLKQDNKYLGRRRSSWYSSLQRIGCPIIERRRFELKIESSHHKQRSFDMDLKDRDHLEIPTGDCNWKDRCRRNEEIAKMKLAKKGVLTSEQRALVELKRLEAKRLREVKTRIAYNKAKLLANNKRKERIHQYWKGREERKNEMIAVNAVNKLEEELEDLALVQIVEKMEEGIEIDSCNGGGVGDLLVKDTQLERNPTLSAEEGKEISDENNHSLPLTSHEVSELMETGEVKRNEVDDRFAADGKVREETTTGEDEVSELMEKGEVKGNQESEGSDADGEDREEAATGKVFGDSRGIIPLIVEEPENLIISQDVSTSIPVEEHLVLRKRRGRPPKGRQD